MLALSTLQIILSSCNQRPTI